MKKIFDGKIYEILPKSDGIIFPYQKAVIDQGDVVWYKMLSIENSSLTDVSENIYLNIKFGSNYSVATGICKNFVAEKALVLPDGRTLLCNANGQVFIIDNDGMINISGEMKYRDETPSALAYYKNCIWASFRENNVLIRFNIATMRNELRIGGKTSPFSAPEDIFIDGEYAYVSNGKANNVIKVNLESYSVDELYTFEEPVLKFIKSGNFEFVQLESGLYVI
ncbi:MAG: hypothetical protein IKT42_00135 [Clostridia bacterium]|nr:hypothetical protein [Clostridia bacterium]